MNGNDPRVILGSAAVANGTTGAVMGPVLDAQDTIVNILHFVAANNGDVATVLDNARADYEAEQRETP